MLIGSLNLNWVKDKTSRHSDKCGTHEPNWSPKAMLLFVFLSTCFLYCDGAIIKRATPHFHGAKVSTVTASAIDEASGLCASHEHPGILYTHNDSGGNDHRIYAIEAKTGNLKTTFTIDHAHNTDWEDIACGPCHGGHEYCIFIADTGGNTRHDANTIYRIIEPVHVHTQTVPVDSTLKFSWDEANCETLMVDNSGELYIISKVHGGHGKFYNIPSSAWGDNDRVQLHGGVRLNIDSTRNDPVGGDISHDGKEILVKALGKIYYWYVPDRNYKNAIVHTPAELPYTRERQGESVCWDKYGRGYFTLGEGSDSPLYYYQRQGTQSAVG